MAPLLKAGGEYGLSYLLGAWCTDAALDLVVIQASLLERHPAEIENPAHLCFQVADDILVLHAQDETRQNPVPMIHKLHVLPMCAVKACRTKWSAPRRDTSATFELKWRRLDMSMSNTEKTVKDIRRNTRRRFSTEEK